MTDGKVIQISSYCQCSYGMMSGTNRKLRLEAGGKGGLVDE